MGWVTVRYALAHILPGLVPTLLLIHYAGPQPLQALIDAFGEISVYLLTALFFGAMIELMRPWVQGTVLFTNAPNPFRWVFGQFKKVHALVTRKQYTYRSLAWMYDDYKKKEEGVIKFWLQQRYVKQDADFKEAVESDNMLKKQYIEPTTITSGDRWAVLIVRENNSLKFMVDEYFSYYQFAFNLWLSGMLAGIINLVLWIRGQVEWKEALVMLAVLILVHFVLHAITMYWWLAMSRFARKLIVFSSIK